MPGGVHARSRSCHVQHLDHPMGLSIERVIKPSRYVSETKEISFWL
jgi:hypothetical protein